MKHRRIPWFAAEEHDSYPLRQMWETCWQWYDIGRHSAAVIRACINFELTKRGEVPKGVNV